MNNEELKQKLSNVMLTKDTKLLGKALRNWAKDNNVDNVSWQDLGKENIYGYYSDYNPLDGDVLDRLTFRLKWFDHLLEIVFRGHGGHYLLIIYDNVRVYEFGPNNRCFNYESAKLMEAYGIYGSLFDKIFADFNVYLDKEDDNVEMTTVTLTTREKSFLKAFAEKQHPGAKDNVGTIFPTIHVVRDVEYLPAPEDYGDGSYYEIVGNDYDRQIFEEFEDFKEAVTDYLEDYILSNYVPSNEKISKEVKKIFEAIPADCYHGFYNMGEKLQDLLKRHCSGDIVEILDSYLAVYDELTCHKDFIDFAELNEAIENIVGYKNFEVQLSYYHEVKKPIAFFLIREEAEKYLKYQTHNLKKPDIFTYSIGYGNKGDLEPLANVLLKLGQELAKEKGE